MNILAVKFKHLCLCFRLHTKKVEIHCENCKVLSRVNIGSQRFLSKSNPAWYNIELQMVICSEEPEWATDL